METSQPSIALVLVRQNSDLNQSGSGGASESWLDSAGVLVEDKATNFVHMGQEKRKGLKVDAKYFGLRIQRFVRMEEKLGIGVKIQECFPHLLLETFKWNDKGAADSKSKFMRKG